MEVIEDPRTAPSTVVAAQAPIAEWQKLIGGPTAADRVMDHLVPAAQRITLDGKSKRETIPWLTRRCRGGDYHR